MKSMLTVALLAAALPTLASAPAVAATLQVAPGVPSADPNVRLRSFVPGGFTGPFGQSFTAIDSTLNTIGFQFNALNPNLAGAAYTLTLLSGETLTGSSLVSRTFTLPASINSNTPVWYDIDIGAIGAVIGQRYTAVLSSSDFRNGIVLGPIYSYTTGSQVSGDTYAGGRFFSGGNPVYSDCPNTPASPCDLNFRVTGTTAIAAVPEPASWATMLGGFFAAGGVLRRRSRQTARA